MRFRVLTTVVTVAVAVAMIGTTTQCRTPTQVIIRVSTDARCDQLTTAIFVGKTSALDIAVPIVTRRGCEREGFIGSAVLLPSGEDDDAFAAKIITGVGVRVEDCINGTSLQSCITERRALRYEPNEIVRVDVFMGQQCAGIQCAPKETCQKGLCVPCADCVDQTLIEAGAPDVVTNTKDTGGENDAATEIDAGPCLPPCTSCAGATCVVDCKLTNCAQGIVCPANRRCQVECNGGTSCGGVISCVAATACDVTCSEKNDACTGTIDCGTGPCRVRCIGPGERCNSLTIAGVKPKSFCLECIGPEKVCNSITCTVPITDCSRNCTGCNSQDYCAGCTDVAACPPP
jgi:hypothetical protein